ncbi:MAG: hypothetical protein HRU12_10345, partial [Phaeodactylibacter sp.]|nr:hypothetical protein [Phaeodactylibacter sp.]
MTEKYIHLKKKNILFTALLALTPMLLQAEKRPEAFYQQIAAEVCGGETEVRMPDGSRCDIVTEHFAIEADFANKFKESLGQSLNYAFQSNKRAGILLIIEKETDSLRLMSLIQHFDLPITVWTIDA